MQNYSQLYFQIINILIDFNIQYIKVLFELFTNKNVLKTHTTHDYHYHTPEIREIIYTLKKKGDHNHQMRIRSSL